MINLEEKKQIVKELRSKLKSAKLAILSDFTGLKNSDMENLRSKLREENIEYKIAKKSLLKRAGIETDHQGSIGLAISKDDEIAPAKILYNSDAQMISGILDGKVVDLTILEKFAKLPSRDELLQKLSLLLKNNINKLILCLKSIKK